MQTGKNYQARQISVNDFPSNGTMYDQTKFLLGFAVLAPSTHNIQPWLFKVDKNKCSLYLNKELILPYTDPLDRCAYISMGCCLENLLTAANYYGYSYKVNYVFDKTTNLIVEIEFSNRGSVNNNFKQLTDAILKRTNSRGVWQDKKIDESILNKIKDTQNQITEADISFITDAETIKSLAHLTATGMKMAHAQKKFRLEMSKWINNNFSKKKDGMPGYSMKMPDFISLFLPKLLSKFNLGGILSKLNYKSVLSAPLVCVFSGDANPRVWEKIGEQAEKIMLIAASEGMTAAVYVASVEIGELGNEVQKVIGCNALPQFFLCVGYMPKPKRLTPRHYASTKIIN